MGLDLKILKIMVWQNTERIVMESKKVGVVIPIFNTEASLLKQCIESVITQTYKNLEICLINDGSTQEEVLEICKKYCRSDVRITLIHKQYNGGLSETRNAAIEWFSIGKYFYTLQNPKTRESLYAFSVKGENPYKITRIYKAKKLFKGGDVEAYSFCAPRIDYLIFLDSDDTWKQELVQECLQCAQGMDIVWFQTLPVHAIKTTSRVYKVQKEELFFGKEGVISYKEWVDTLQNAEDVTHCLSFVWRFFIDFNYLKRIQLEFVNQCFAEDHHFSMLLLYQADNIYVLPKKLVYYLVRANSETNHTSDRENVNIPHYFAPLLEVVRGNRALVRDLFVKLSFYVMKLRVQDFIRQHQNRYGIAIFTEKFLQHFRKEYQHILYLKHSLKTEFYLSLVMRVLLCLNEDYKLFRPFSRLAKALEVDSGEGQKRDIEAQFVIDMLSIMDKEVVHRNAIISDLQKNIKELEEENSELYLQSLESQEDHKATQLRVFR